MFESRRMEAWFAEAVELDPAGRERLYERVDHEQAGSAKRLRSLVEVLEERPGFLTTAPEISAEDLQHWVGAPQDGPAVNRDSLAFLAASDRVAGYELVRVIGYGGMGVVYEATQRRPRRRVALKLLRATDASPSVLRRFEAEAEILARLRHPAIAQVFEAGVETLEGQAIPYLAMELIPQAQTIVQYAAERRLDERARARLFREVAEAVQHAHEQGVIHRDLKPANILVGEDGRPKIIDFGIASIVDGDESTNAITQTRGVLGTISYMSPEQLGADDQAVDARTDVYALGVVLYELLCDTLPYDLERSSLPEVVRAIVHQPPPVPSRVGHVLTADLETIVLKALRKTREERYDSAAEFAADVDRYLNHEPIAARPPSLTYRLRLLSRRRPGLLASILISLVVVAAGIGVSSWLWVRAERLRSQAETVRTELREVRAALGSVDAPRAEFEPFATGILASVESSLATAETDQERARLLTWAVDTLQRLEPQGGDDKELLTAIAETYIDLGGAYGSEWEAGPEKVAGSVGAYRRAEEILAGLVEREPEEFDLLLRLVRSQMLLSQTLRKLDRDMESMRLADKSVANAERLTGLRPHDTSALGALVAALWARGDAAIGLQDGRRGLEDSTRATEISRELLEREPDSVRAICYVAWSAFRVGAWYQHNLEQPVLALEAFAEANDQRLRLVRVDPERPEVVSDLLWYTDGEIQLLERFEGPAVAADRLARFLEAAGVAARASTTEVRFAGLFAEKTERLGDLLVAAGRTDEAVVAGHALIARLETLEAGDDEAEPLAQAIVQTREWVDQLRG